MLIIVSLLLSFNCQAEATIEKKAEIATPADKAKKVPTVLQFSSLHPAAINESWYLSGLIESEQGGRFAYYFVVQRLNEQFSYFTQIINIDTKAVIYKRTETAQLSLATRLGINFKIGDGFLRYNEINDSWLFGVDEKHGFNLRVESLQTESYKVNHLKHIYFYTLQSKRVNGQLSLDDDKVEFVTAKNAWLSHQWQDPGEENDITIERLLCRSVDNEGVMLLKAYSNGKVIYSQADLLDQRGESHPVSQFSVLSQTKPTQWKVKIFSPKKNFEITSQLPQQSIIDTKTVNYYLGTALTINQSNQLTASGGCVIIKESIEMAKTFNKKELISQDPEKNAEKKEAVTSETSK